MGVGPRRRVVQAEQFAHRSDDRRDRPVRVVEMAARAVGGGVGDQHGGAVAAAVAVVGDEADVGMAVDERGGQRAQRRWP